MSPETRLILAFETAETARISATPVVAVYLTDPTQRSPSPSQPASQPEAPLPASQPAVLLPPCVPGCHRPASTHGLAGTAPPRTRGFYGSSHKAGTHRALGRPAPVAAYTRHFSAVKAAEARWPLAWPACSLFDLTGETVSLPDLLPFSPSFGLIQVFLQSITNYLVILEVAASAQKQNL